MEDISVHQLKEMLDSKEEFLFLDVREQHEYEEFNLGAKLIPLASLPFALDELALYQNKKVVVHCRSGARSGRAKEFLVANGFTDVSNVLGGVLAWSDAFGQ
jgi:rhodanese-related sulfurtransferase